MERAVKGGNCENTLACVKQRLGDAGYEAFLASLPPDVQALCRRRILAVEWVPYSLWQHVSNGILSHVCGGDEARYIQFNRDLAESALNSTYKFILRFLKASNVLSRVCREFPKLNNVGSAEIVSSGTAGDRTLVKMRVVDHAPWHCYALALHGIIVYVLDITGAKDVVIDRGPSQIGAGGLSVEFSVSYRV